MRNDIKDFRLFATDRRVSGTQFDDYIRKVTGGWQSPTIIENTPTFGVAIDIYSRMFQDGIIFIGTEIDDIVGNIVTSQILYLNSIDPEKDITIHLNTPGGSVTDGLSIYDSMLYVNNQVNTVCTGIAASMGAVLLCAGEFGHRYAQKHSRIMIHEVSSGQRGKMSDMEDSFRETKKLNAELFEILALHTGHSVKDIEDVALRRDFWMSSSEAKDFGIIDNIFTPTKVIKAPQHNLVKNEEDNAAEKPKRSRKK